MDGRNSTPEKSLDDVIMNLAQTRSSQSPPVEMLPTPNRLYELCRGQTLPVPGRRTGPHFVLTVL